MRDCVKAVDNSIVKVDELFIKNLVSKTHNVVHIQVTKKRDLSTTLKCRHIDIFFQ